MYVYYGFYQYMWCVVHNLHIIIKYTVLFIAASMQPTDSHRRLLLIWTKPWDSQPANQSWFDKNNALNCIPICSFPSKFIIIISFMWSLELLNCSSFIEIILIKLKLFSMSTLWKHSHCGLFQASSFDVTGHGFGKRWMIAKPSCSKYFTAQG